MVGELGSRGRSAPGQWRRVRPPPLPRPRPRPRPLVLHGADRRAKRRRSRWSCRRDDGVTGRGRARRRRWVRRPHVPRRVGLCGSSQMIGQSQPSWASGYRSFPAALCRWLCRLACLGYPRYPRCMAALPLLCPQLALGLSADLRVVRRDRPSCLFPSRPVPSSQSQSSSPTPDGTAQSRCRPDSVTGGRRE